MLTPVLICKSLSNGYDVLEESQSTGSNHLDNMVIKAYKLYIHNLSYKLYIILVQVPHYSKRDEDDTTFRGTLTSYTLFI